MQDWRRTTKTIAVTFLVTSAAWLIGGAVLFQRWRGEVEPVGVATPNADNAGARGEDVKLASTVRVPLPERGSARALILPVAGVRPEQLVDTFTQAREGGARVHDAIDIMAPRGTPVIAAAPGRVEKLFVSARGGNTAYVRSLTRTLIYYYAHLDSYAPRLAEGAVVRAGDAIGTVGSTGNANPSAPHLHFAILRSRPDAKWWDATVAVNPYPLLAGR